MESFERRPVVKYSPNRVQPTKSGPRVSLIQRPTPVLPRRSHLADKQSEPHCEVVGTSFQSRHLIPTGSPSPGCDGLPTAAIAKATLKGSLTG